MANNTDLRVLKTRENIKTSFINLLLIKDFKDITIQNIIDEALIGRSTFYDHYCDKYDLLKQLVDELITDFKLYIKGRFNIKSHDDFMIFFLSMIDFYSKQRNKLLALLKVHTESVDLYNSIINVLKDACSSYFDSMQINTKFSIPKEFFCRIYASIVMTSIQWFVENNEDYTPQDFTELFSTLKILSSELL
ncbi:AcrR family transcriptional regulator [Clostridium gelidum]|uniref:AcrR family transcriptional regulator n=1 Tax=Clostridium gelidum TaxID=704125 RepID=A0ABM7T0R6_9CLOT|nr:TetR/AcrR family transcriptional regulator C-terminal domain-containing protein [Clostridium gelidum]BCZ44788.1 AcrR family transcriptional regulator [Clostridium gelidum]